MPLFPIMKTDRFSDIIRRKLESIRPEFTDKDWTRMQASLQQAMPPQPGSPTVGTPFSGGVWSGSSWLLAAASVSTVVLIAFSIWQRSEINTLREAVGQLKQQSVATQPAQSSTTPDSPTLSKRDSQYRSLPAPETGADVDTEQSLPGNRDTAASTRSDALPNSVRQETTEERSTSRMDIPPKQRDVVASRTPVSVDDARPQTKSNKNLKTDEYGASSTPLINNQSISTPSVAVDKPVRQSVSDRAGQSVDESATGQIEEYAGSSKKKNRNRSVEPGTGTIAYDRTTPSGNKSGVSPDRSANPTQLSTPTNAGTQTADKVTNRSSSEPLSDSREVAKTVEPATSLPMSLPDRDWNSAMIRRAKRMRLVQPPVPAATQAVAKAVKAPASQPVTPLAAGLRVGVGSDVDAHMWSAGAFSEIQLGKHWALGVGLSQATYLGGLFITAYDFDNRTHRDFQKEFGPRLNPKQITKDDDILNIDTRVQRFQIPLSLSYRIPLSRTLTLLPTVGTYLNLSSTEKIACYFRDTPGRFDQASFSASRPVTLLNTFAFGTSLEWQSQHWAIQGSPLLTLPIKSDPDWQTGAIVGLRMRVYYQF